MTFTSQLELQHRPALEKLIFFNPEQNRVRRAILECIAEFGQPRLVNDRNYVRIHLGDLEPQTLFAFENGVLAGFASYLRTKAEEVSILHAGVDPQASSDTLSGLIDKIVGICRRIVGVERVVLPYRKLSLNC